MSRILFDYAGPVAESDPARNDIACFVGLARVTGAALPAAIQNWLQLHGWTNGPLARSTDPPFTDIPIPLESYATFTSLFDPGGSTLSNRDGLSRRRRAVVLCAGRKALLRRAHGRSFVGDGGQSAGKAGRVIAWRSLRRGRSPKLARRGALGWATGCIVPGATRSSGALGFRFHTGSRRSSVYARRSQPVCGVHSTRCHARSDPALSASRAAAHAGRLRQDLGSERADHSRLPCAKQYPRDSIRSCLSPAPGSGCCRGRRKPFERRPRAGCS